MPKNSSSSDRLDRSSHEPVMPPGAADFSAFSQASFSRTSAKFCSTLAKSSPLSLASSSVELPLQFPAELFRTTLLLVFPMRCTTPALFDHLNFWASFHFVQHFCFHLVFSFHLVGHLPSLHCPQKHFSLFFTEIVVRDG